MYKPKPSRTSDIVCLKIAIDDVSELIHEVENNLHIPKKFWPLTKEQWMAQKPIYVTYLRQELDKFQIRLKGRTPVNPVAVGAVHG